MKPLRSARGWICAVNLGFAGTCYPPGTSYPRQIAGNTLRAENRAGISEPPPGTVPAAGLAGDDRMTDERSLLIEDASELLGISRRTVYYRIREGRLKTIRTRCGSQRILLSSIERLLCEMRGLPAPPAQPSAISRAAGV